MKVKDKNQQAKTVTDDKNYIQDDNGNVCMNLACIKYFQTCSECT